MDDYSQEFMYTLGDFPDSPTMGMEKNEATAVAKIENWLHEPTFQPISPSSLGYDEDKVFTPMENVEMDFLSQSIQEAGITSDFPQTVVDFNLNSGDLMNGNIPSPSLSSYNETAETMGLQTSSIPCNEILLSCGADMMSSVPSSPKVLSVSPHPHYLELGPSSVESSSSVSSNNQGGMKSGRKARRRTRAPKKKLYEIEEPFEDPAEERKRLNAIKAHRNRQKKGGFLSKLERENNDLKSSLAERDRLIKQLQKTIFDINSTRTSDAAKIEQIRQIVCTKIS